MLKQRRDVSRNITLALVATEAHIDDALLSHAKLQIALIEGRRSANLPLDAGQAGIDKITEAVANLVAARRAMNEAHYAFRAARDELRMPVTSYGDTGDTPLGEGIAAQTPVLALVNAA
jgi:hypothetical protein